LALLDKKIVLEENQIKIFVAQYKLKVLTNKNTDKVDL
jgi:hypothetical protein